MGVLKTKYRKHEAVGLGRTADWIAPQKVPYFKILFDRIRVQVGTYDGAKDFIGFGASTADRLENGLLSKDSAQKILDAYNKIKNTEKQ